MDTSRWAQALTEAFPNLANENFEVVGGPSDRYNCVAYAANKKDQPWDYNHRGHWPPWANRNDRIESLKQVFLGLECEECRDSELEDGYQKVALFEVQGQAKHAALQMPNGRWRSKIGDGPLIEHDTPESLAGELYGNPTVFLRRMLNATP